MGLSFFTLRGQGVLLAMDALLTCRVSSMRPGQTARGFLLDKQGKVIDAVGVRYIARTVDPARGVDEDECVVCTKRADEVVKWLRQVFDGNAPLNEVEPPARLKRTVEIAPADEDRALACDDAPLESAAGRTFVDITKPFFVGQAAIAAGFSAPALPVWRPPRIERERPLPKTLLGQEHDKIGVSQWGPFGSCTMPIQYAAGPTAISDEHLATRCAAAVYDVSHMIPIIVRGRDSRAFLQMCLVNDVTRLHVGHCQYQAMCLPDGTPQDDLYLNHLEHDESSGEDVYLLVANSGHEADYFFLRAVAEAKVAIDPQMPSSRFEGEVSFICRLDQHSCGGQSNDPLYSVSIQGPKSKEILLAAVHSDDPERVEALKFNALATGVRLQSTGRPMVITRTGYCGEPTGFECYTNAQNLVLLWRALVAGGAKPAGLGARDSTRQEAGLPLFGHEIDGPLEIPLTGGRYKSLVAFDKPFFTGRKVAWQAEKRRTKRVFLLAAEGPRKVSQGWLVYGSDGDLLGQVTSTSTIRPGKTDVTQAYLEETGVRTGDRVVITPPSKAPKPGQKADGRVFVVTTWDKKRDYTCQ